MAKNSHMIIIGERINASRQAIERALEQKDEAAVQKEAKRQIERGADYLDVNCGLSRKDEERDMEWLIQAIRKVSDIPLCIDSPNPACLEKGIRAGGRNCLINSITAEESRYKKILPLALEQNCGIIALTMDESGIPHTASDRVTIAHKIYTILRSEGPSDDNIYFDPLARPIASEPRQARELISAIPRIKG